MNPTKISILMNDRTTQLILANNKTIQFKEQEISMSFFMMVISGPTCVHLYYTTKCPPRHRQTGKNHLVSSPLGLKTEKASLSTDFIEH